MKNVLVLSYSQSGQLNEILSQFTSNLEANIEHVKIEMEHNFPFPWTPSAFYDAMPESVLEEPATIIEPKFKNDRYDLIIFGFQPWFLSPSIPTTSALKHPAIQKIMQDTPVMTILGSRNMWINAQESVKKMIFSAGGRLVGHIPLFDRSPNLLSAVAIVHWMMTGKKTRKWGVFPKPGVSDSDIQYMSEYAPTVQPYLEKAEFDGMQDAILAHGKIRILTNILFVESRAKKLFNIWAYKIKEKGTTPKKRRKWLRAFRIYLNVALFGISPIVLIIFNLIIRPLTFTRIKKQKQYFCSINLK